MAKTVLFSKLKLEKNIAVNTITINEVEIEVKKYIPVALKSMFIESAVRGSLVQGIVDEILMDAYLHVLIFENYTNITLTEKQKANLLDTFDLIQSNGILEQIIAAMPSDEYDYIFNSALKLAKSVNEYNLSLAGLIEKNLDKFNLDNIQQQFLNGQTN